jgi:hypothetical protein
VRVLGFPLLLPIASARSKSGSITTWSNSTRGAGPRAASSSRVGAPVRRSARPGGHPPGPVYAIGALWADREGASSSQQADAQDDAVELHQVDGRPLASCGEFADGL